MRTTTRGGRTNLWLQVRQAMRWARAVKAHGAGQVSDQMGEMMALRQRTGERGVSRRQVLKGAAGMAGAAGLMSAGLWAPGCTTTQARPKAKQGAPNVAIVGGGIGGLNAAHHLTKAGVPCTIYEASRRVGGRIRTGRGLIHPQVNTEIGAEFIDTTHEDLLGLVDEFHLEKVDQKDPALADLHESYYFGGKHYSLKDLAGAFAAVATRIAADAGDLEEVVDYQHEGKAGKLDRMSIAEYLASIEMDKWVRELLTVAYVTEYGLDAAEQSALNMVFMIDTDVSDDEVLLFGDSDERYTIRGGNERITEVLGESLADHVQLQHHLQAVRGRGTGYTLVFQTAGGGTKEVNADLVILAIPFTILRDVDIQVELPDFKRKAIKELSYGANSKVMTGFSGRAWAERKFSGETFTDESYQMCWDHSLAQKTKLAGITFYLGGKNALRPPAPMTPGVQADQYVAALDKVFPGAAAARAGRTSQYYWPHDPLVKGSYSAYTVGQWTTISGAEIVPVAGLFFAGEHCSPDFQGFMNGGAITGRLAAEAVLQYAGLAAEHASVRRRELAAV